MSDVHCPAVRSKNMRAIKAKDTAPEMAIRKLLHAAGFRYRLYCKSLPGKPDMVFAKHRAVIFVHGCFWHGHGCHSFKLPNTRREFWSEKINSNISRDARVQASLREDKWRVITVWECALKGKLRRSKEEIVQWLTDAVTSQEEDGRTLSHSN